MRIGIVTSSYPISPMDTVTAGVFVRDLARELVTLGHEVHVITPRKNKTIISDDNLHIHVIPWWGGERDLASASMRSPFTIIRYATLIGSGLWLVPRFARMHHLDAILAMWAIPSGLLAWATWKRWRIPYGVWVLGSDIWARHKYPLGNTVVRRVLHDAFFCFADGINLAHDAAELANRNCEFVPSMRRLPSRVECQAKLKPNTSHFLYIGRYEYNKGPDVLVSAMRWLLDSGVTACLHMFGVGSMKPLLDRQIEGYEHCISVGGYADPETVMAYMQACDWLVIPSRIESIPLVLVDAIQMRLPVVATNVGDVGKLVNRYSMGKAVPAEDSVALAKAMRWATKHTKAEFESALAKAAGDFDLTRSAVRCARALAKAGEGVQ